jgi:phage gp46-like protein
MVATIPAVFVKDGTEADWRIIDPSSVTLPHLVSAIVVALFTDRRAGAADVLPDGGDDRRGVWFDPGDGAAAEPEAWIGSRLWLLAREKATEEVRSRIEAYCREALAFLVTDGVAGRVDVSTRWAGIGALEIRVDAYRTGGEPVALKFEHVWS